MTPEVEGLNLIELLDLLDATPDPAPIAMTPQTPGWIVLGAVIALGALWIVRTLVHRRRAGAYRRAGLAALARVGDDPAGIADVLRRTALAAYPRAEVAGLHGNDWLAFLDATGPGGFTGSAGRTMIAAPYRAVPIDPDLPDLARAWIRRHRVGRGTN